MSLAVREDRPIRSTHKHTCELVYTTKAKHIPGKKSTDTHNYSHV